MEHPDAQTFREQWTRNTQGESLIRLVADSVPALIAYYEAKTEICLFANTRYASYNGWDTESILGKTVKEAIGEAAYTLIKPYVDAAMAGRSSRYQREQVMPDGSKRRIEVNLLPHYSEAQRLLGCYVLINDITDHWRIQEALRQSEERLGKFVQATQEGIIFHRTQTIVDINEAALRISGYGREDVLGRRTLEFVPERLHEAMTEHFLSGNEEPYESALVHKLGHEVPLECVSKQILVNGEMQRLLVLRDISYQRQAQARIAYLAMHDTLTNLPNRTYLRERLEAILALARRHQGNVAVLFLDLDHFKTVNDSLGHHIGDALLCEVARRITGTVRDSDVVSRLGGDEFVVVLSELNTSDDAATVAHKLVEAVNSEFVLDEHVLNVSPSIGIALFPEDGETTDELIRHADAAMYAAKDSGRATFKFFAQDMFHRATGALALERQLRAAIQRGEFLLHYQPLLGKSGKVVCLEALVRWQHPQRGLLGPDAFIQFAEARGLIGAIDQWVLQAVCRQQSLWDQAGLEPLPVAVNLSAVNFKQGKLVDEVSGLLLEHGLQASRLEIEITETVLMNRDSHVLDTLRRLAGMGICLVLDDFGTGYSSLSYLKRYPISKIKIDRSFVQDIATDQGDLALVTAIIQMAHGLKLTAVAEGIESSAQLELLKSLGCDKFQGFHISAPLPAAQARLYAPPSTMSKP